MTLKDYHTCLNYFLREIILYTHPCSLVFDSYPEKGRDYPTLGKGLCISPSILHTSMMLPLSLKHSKE